MKEKRSALEGFWECYHLMYLVMRVTPETRMPLSDHYRMTIFFRRFHVSDLHVSLTSIGGGSHLKLCPIFLLVVSRNNQPHQMGRGWLNLQGLCNQAPQCNLALLGASWCIHVDQKYNKNSFHFFGKSDAQQTSLCNGHAMPCFHAFRKNIGSLPTGHDSLRRSASDIRRSSCLADLQVADRL